MLELSSRRQLDLEARGPRFLENLNRLAGTRAETMPHDGTLAYFLERLPPEELAFLPARMTNRLIRMKALDKFRLFHFFLIAVDGSGIQTFRRPHCPFCLTSTRNGRTLYYHQVLEAKLVTSSGLAFSIATEFIENTDPKATRQDCELKAFHRLAARLKRTFPQLRICLLLDSLYAAGPVFDICRQNHWRFIVTFKKGSIPGLYQEFLTLRRIQKNHRLHLSTKNGRSLFTWVNDLNHQHHSLAVFEQIEYSPERHRFVFLTNFRVSQATVRLLSEKGGRLRWKIENQGFNIQKNSGYNLGHDYSRHPNAAKHFYFLLQAAHILNQLMVHGSLLKGFQDMLGSLRNFSRRLAEHVRYLTVPDQVLSTATAGPAQIRLDSS